MLRLVAALWLASAACTFSDHGQPQLEKQALTVAEKEGTEASLAMDALVQKGRRALPVIELAMHNARPTGKKNLIVVLRRIGDAEAVPLLQHVAAYDKDEDVRLEARHTLETWAKDPDSKEAGRGQKAKDAIRRVDELSNRQEAG